MANLYGIPDSSDNALYGTDTTPYGVDDNEKLKAALAARQALASSQGDADQSGIKVSDKSSPTVTIKDLPDDKSDDDSDEDEDDSQDKVPAAKDTDDDSDDDDALSRMKGTLSTYDNLKNKPVTNPQANIADLINRLTNGSNNQALQQAQQQVARTRSGNIIGMGANIMGAAMGGPKGEVYNQGYDEANKNANVPVQNILDQQKLTGENLGQAATGIKLQDELQKNDAGSPISQQYRDAVQKMTGKVVSPNTSASDLDKLSPLYEKMWQAQENSKNRLAQAQMMQGIRQGNLDYTRTAAQQKALNGDKVYQAAQTGNTAADELDAALDQIKMNPANAKVLSQSIPVIGARMLTHGQRINQMELQQLTGDPSFSGAIQRITARAATGTMSDNDYNQFKQLVQVYKQSAASTMQQQEMQHANQFSQLNGNDVGQNYTKLTGKQYNPNTSPSAAPQKSVNQGPTQLAPNEVTRQTKDGKTAIFDKNTKEFLRYQ